MTKHSRKAKRVSRAAVLAPDFRPNTLHDWQRAQKALIDIGYCMFRDMGMPHEQATLLSDVVYGGESGLVLLKAALKEGDHD